MLNEKLLRRPDRNQLISKEILHDSQCTPSLQNAKYALKRAHPVDHVNMNYIRNLL